MSTSINENQKELEFVQKITLSLGELRSVIGDLKKLPTSDKSSIVNAINSLTIGQYEDPKIDPEVIIRKFEEKLI